LNKYISCVSFLETNNNPGKPNAVWRGDYIIGFIPVVSILGLSLKIPLWMIVSTVVVQLVVLPSTFGLIVLPVSETPVVSVLFIAMMGITRKGNPHQ